MLPCPNLRESCSPVSLKYATTSQYLGRLPPLLKLIKTWPTEIGCSYRDYYKFKFYDEVHFGLGPQKSAVFIDPRGSKRDTKGRKFRSERNAKSNASIVLRGFKSADAISNQSFTSTMVQVKELL